MSISKRFSITGLKSMRRQQSTALIGKAIASEQFDKAISINRARKIFEDAELHAFLNWWEQLDASHQEIVLLHPHNQAGRLVHFHHFFSGFLAPLIELLQVGVLPRNSFVLYPHVGPLEDKVRDVFGHFDIQGRSYPRGLQSWISATGQFLDLHVPGFDKPEVIGSHLSAWQFSVLRQFRDAFVGGAPAPNDTDKVIIIDRTEPEQFYLSDVYNKEFGKSVEGAASASRRSIPNMDEIRKRVDAEFGLKVADLDRLPLRDAMKLFRAAKVIVAQHGAGINNIAWCEPPAVLIEIVPVSHQGMPSRIFRNMCGYAGLHHVTVLQDGPHAPVCPERLVKQIQFCADQLDLGLVDHRSANPTAGKRD